MKNCGVIVEYNPFHNGHHYHLKKARQQSQANIVIAVMSGNFLQRGEPAVLDKWSRAGAALSNGADLVIELPFCWSVQSADYFARGAVKILQQIGCENLCFGTDSQNEFDYQKFGNFVKENQGLIDDTFQKIADTPLNYPQKMTAVFREIYPENQLDFSSPNHILGLSYAKENANYVKPMHLLPISRQMAAYHDQTAGQGKIASATAIRNLIIEGKSVEQFVPVETAQQLQKDALVNWENYWPFLKYQILASDVTSLANIYQMNEGLEYLFQKAALKAESFSEFIQLLKSKRYTRVRLQRLCLYVLGQVTEKEIFAAQKNQPLRILGFTQSGQQFIKENKELPWISRFGKNETETQALTLKMDRLYQLGSPKIREQNFGRQPLRF